MFLVENDDVVEALAADGTDQAFHERILPRRPRRDEHFSNTKAVDASGKGIPVNAVSIADHVADGRLPGGCLDDLLRGPPCGRELRDVGMQDAPTIMGEHQEDETNPEGSGRDGEEVNGDQRLDVVIEEGSPGLRWRLPPAGHVLGHGGLGDVDSELEQLTVNSRGTPERIGRGHATDEVAEVARHGGSAVAVTPTLPAPVELEALAMPAHDGIWLDDDEAGSPVLPVAGKPDPQDPIPRAKTRALDRAPEDGELVAQREVLGDQGDPPCKQQPGRRSTGSPSTWPSRPKQNRRILTEQEGTEIPGKLLVSRRTTFSEGTAVRPGWWPRSRRGAPASWRSVRSACRRSG